MNENPPQSYQLRPGLEFSPQQHQGKSFVVVKDPVTARYFRFTEAQAACLGFSKKKISRSNWIFDDDEGFALMLLRRKLEAGSKMNHYLPNTTRPCDLTDRRVQLGLR